MADYSEGINLEVAIARATSVTTWKAAIALGAAEGADETNLPELSAALAMAGLDWDEVRAGREEAKR